MSTNRPPIIWLNAFIFTVTLAIAVIATPLYAYFVGFDWAQVIMLVLAFSYCGMSITAGYHRLVEVVPSQFNG